MCGTTHKTVKRIVAAQLADQQRPARRARTRNFDPVAAVVRDKVAKTQGKIWAKRLLRAAVAAADEADEEQLMRRGQISRRYARRPPAWT